MMLFILYRDGRRKSVRVHTVKKGETLWKIARQYGISFEDMKRLNAHLANPDYIVPGMELFLPDAPKKEQPKSQPKEYPRVQPKEYPVARPKEQPVTPPKEQPVARPKEQPVTRPKEQPVTRPKEHPIARPKEQPVTRPKEHPIARPKEQPVTRPKEHPIAKPKEQPVVKPKEIPIPIPIPIEEPKPIPHIHPFEEARPIRARIELTEQHEEEFFIQPQKEHKPEPECEPCAQAAPLPAPVPIPAPPPMPCPPPMPMPCAPIPCFPQYAAPQYHHDCGCGGHQSMPQWPAPVPVQVPQWPVPVPTPQWPVQSSVPQWTEPMVSPVEQMTPTTQPSWAMPESTRECEEPPSYQHHDDRQEFHQQPMESWYHAPAMPYPNYVDPYWNFGPPIYQHNPMPQAWPGHYYSPYPPAQHWPQPQPHHVPNFPQAGYESC